MVGCGVIERDAVHIDGNILWQIVTRHDHVLIRVGLLETGACSRLLAYQILPCSAIHIVASVRALCLQSSRCAGPILPDLLTRRWLPSSHFVRDPALLRLCDI